MVKTYSVLMLLIFSLVLLTNWLLLQCDLISKGASIVTPFAVIVQNWICSAARESLYINTRMHLSNTVLACMTNCGSDPKRGTHTHTYGRRPSPRQLSYTRCLQRQSGLPRHCSAANAAKMIYAFCLPPPAFPPLVQSNEIPHLRQPDR